MHALSLADVRLLERLRRGEPDAAEALWEDHRHAMWSVLRAMCAPELAEQLLHQAHQDLPSASRGWAPHTAVCCQLSAWLFRRIGARLELPDINGIPLKPPAVFRAPSQRDVPGLLRSAAPEMRLVYVLDLFFGCPAGDLAGLVGVDEMRLRDARTAVVWHLLSGDAP